MGWQSDGQFKRRWNVYAPRLARMVTKQDPKSPVWFMHVPKSGGSSVHEALRATVPFHRHITCIGALETRRAASILHEHKDDLNLVHEDGPACKKLFDLREAQLLSAMAHGDHLIYGHVIFSPLADQFFGDQYSYVSVLRDPITRVISNYRSTTHEKFFEGSFDDYLDSEVAVLHSQLNLRYFSGNSMVAPDQIDASMEEAKENMKKFDVIGFIEDITKFSDAYGDHLGVKPSIPHYNTGKGKNIALTSSQQDKLLELCASDLALHDYAKGLSCAAI